MNDTASLLPLEKTVHPADQADVADIVRAAAASRTPIYPIGGGVGLRYGVAPERPGIGLSLAGLKRIVDYPDRDLTITVEAGLTLAELAAHLAAQRQRLPVDVPLPAQATIGGALAANASGPRRCAYGTLRDYLLGFSAVEGRGTPFGGGGRVVKNAAGYDMCKLIVGSLGTLAVTTQVTLMVRPMPEASALVACEVDDFDAAERILADVSGGRLLPAAVELVAGPAWEKLPRLVVGFEGPQAEVEWMVTRLTERWQTLSARGISTLMGPQAAELWQRLSDFAMSSANGSTGLAAKIAVRPSAVAPLCRELLRTTAQLSLAAHAASGSILLSVPGAGPEEAGLLVDGKFRPAVAAAGGNLVVLAAPEGARLSARNVWGPPAEGAGLMHKIKQQFDPQGILNPGRFIFPAGPIGSQA